MAELKYRADITHVTPKSLEDVLVSARNEMRKRTLRALDAQIALGNNKYTLFIDGKEAYTKESINYAKKSIQINFGLYALRFSAILLVKTLQRMLRRYYPETKNNTLLGDKKRVVAQVKAWKCERGKPSIPIPKVKEVELTDQQYIAVTVEWPGGYNPLPLANYLAKNANRRTEEKKKKSKNRKLSGREGSGIYGKAAENVRRKIRATKGRGVVQVFARRVESPHTYQPMGTSEKQGSRHPRPIPRDVGSKTSWAVILRLRQQKGQIIGG